MSRHFLPTSATIALFACVALFATTADAAKKKRGGGTDTSVSDFDKSAATSAINGVDLNKCKATNAPKGDGHVMITFTSSGEASNVSIDKGPWVGTPVAKCMAKQFKTVKVPAFKGEAVTVGKSFKFGD